MIEKTIFYGFGGQGIISLGQIWSFFGMKEGKKVSFFPFYGAEKRGGIARAQCIVSDASIASPIITKASSVVVMNQDSLKEALSMCADGALVMLNSSLVSLEGLENADEIEKRFKVVRVPATEIATKLGNIKIANMIMLGALAKQTGALVLDSVQSILESFFPTHKHNLIPLNLEAIEAGVTL